MDVQDSSMWKKILLKKKSIQQKPFFDTTTQYLNTIFFNTHTHKFKIPVQQIGPS